MKNLASNQELAALVNVTKRFPGVVAVDNVSLGFDAGEVHVLLGENGAGKSTIVGMLSGLQEPDDGYLTVRGERTRLSAPTESLAHGINTVFQHTMLVPTLSVFENLVLGMPWWKRPVRNKIEEELAELSKNFGLSVPLDAITNELSLGEQQQIEIARALLRHSRVLILDEATSMLTPQGADELGERMRRMAERGLAVIFITHKLSEAYRFGDRVSVLKQGKFAGEVPPNRLSEMTEEVAVEEMVRLMFGTEETRRKPVTAPKREMGPVRLTATDLCIGDSEDVMGLHNVSFEIRAGEILGVAGIDGNGQNELSQAIAGQKPLRSGNIDLEGRNITNYSVGQRRKLGLRYLTDDRLSEGTVGSFPVATNAVLKDIGAPPFWKFGVERSGQISEHARKLIEHFAVKTPSEKTPVSHLSGGNIQKLLLGRELQGQARVVIFNKPTYGLDIQNIVASRERIGELAKSGMAVLLISTDLDEILELSDRIMVMEQGYVRGTVPNDLSDPQRLRRHIGLLMAGKREAA